MEKNRSYLARDIQPSTPDVHLVLLESGLYKAEKESLYQAEKEDLYRDYIINIREVCKLGRVLPPNQLGVYSHISSRSFDFIISLIYKIHLFYKPFLCIYLDSFDPNTFTVSTLGLSYKIYIYADIESDTYIVEFVNINMLEHVISIIFEKLCAEI
jgi:hypothetical protein